MQGGVAFPGNSGGWGTATPSGWGTPQQQPQQPQQPNVNLGTGYMPPTSSLPIQTGDATGVFGSAPPTQTWGTFGAPMPASSFPPSAPPVERLPGWTTFSDLPPPLQDSLLQAERRLRQLESTARSHKLEDMGALLASVDQRMEEIRQRVASLAVSLEVTEADRRQLRARTDTAVRHAHGAHMLYEATRRMLRPTRDTEEGGGAWTSPTTSPPPPHPQQQQQQREKWEGLREMHGSASYLHLVFPSAYLRQWVDSLEQELSRSEAKLAQVEQALACRSGRRPRENAVPGKEGRGIDGTSSSSAMKAVGGGARLAESVLRNEYAALMSVAGRIAAAHERLEHLKEAFVSLVRQRRPDISNPLAPPDARITPGDPTRSALPPPPTAFGSTPAPGAVASSPAASYTPATSAPSMGFASSAPATYGSPANTSGMWR
ncbi:hypothetical protein CDCA_CDCA17G4396 [Cyanidium caldarium]|uniref:Nucleoporin Nup54 alpha-helical domain-containing protein n=1 Tax=Cyanidium caldarium TaxID=2771 RepID=A0AAV9J1W8_CYACA|nr:hypothetical protein CDCA_CDCA17G4396 [Cyanidium caldarium]